MAFNSESIFSISSEKDFEEVAIDLFRYQRNNNPLYKSYCNYILNGVNPEKIKDIPFLPIEFFKSETVKTGVFNTETIYTSSGTSGTTPSKHHVKHTSWYLTICKTIFELRYGPLKDFRVLALLPSYLERKGSSLIDMVNFFISESNSERGGFFLKNHDELAHELQKPFSGKTLLIGVTFGLLDFAEHFKLNPSNTIIMETGGMKGRRKEMIRSEVHEILKKAFSVNAIHSEYGMTELLSQAYSTGKGLFETPPWMKIMIRQTTDPFTYVKHGKTGGVNVIDLANIDSCAFIQTQDLGRANKNGQFEILGRFDHSDVRGCNLMIG